MSQDLVGDGLPVEGQRERLAHFRIIERFAVHIEHIVIGGEHGGADQILRALALDVLVLLQRVGGVVQLAGAVAVVSGGFGDDLQIDHLVQDGVLVVPVVGIALGTQPLVGGPLLEHERAVGDDVARFDPLLAEFFNGGLGGRERGVVGQHLQEEGDRIFQGHLQGVVIQRLDPQL